MEVAKKFLNNAIGHMIKRMPQNLSEIEKARFTYINLGKLFCFDEHYILGSDKQKNRIYKMAEDNVFDFNQLKQNRKRRAICVSMAKAYCEVLNSIGIEARTYKDIDDPKHIKTIFKADGKIYKVDLQRDLKYIHLNMSTEHFGKGGSSLYSEISKETCAQIDDKIGYSYTGDEALKELVIGLKDEVQDENSLGNKVSKIFIDTPLKLPKVKELEFVERDGLYSHIIKEILSDNENANFHQNTVYNKMDKYNRENFQTIFSTCEYDKNSAANKFRRFIYNKKEKCFQEISNDRLLEFIKDNNYIIREGKIPGLKQKEDFDK